MARKDKRVLGQTNTFLEPVVDFNRLRRERLSKTQREMAARDIGALVLTDTMNIRYTTGIAVMPLTTATNLAHYTLVPVEGDSVIFEYSLARFRVDQFWPGSRPAHYWQARFVDQMAGERSDEWAAQIKDTLLGLGLADARIGVDNLDYYGFTALQRQGLKLTDADEPVEAALYDMEQAIRPGITENELLAICWRRMLALGGEHCFTRLLASGYKTNPWFHEAGSKMVRPGDLVGLDTDLIGPEGYACDISRTFLCGDRATPVQKEAYKVAHDFIQAAIELVRPGASYADLTAHLPEIPEAYRAQLYSTVVHGVGTDDEPPFIGFPGGQWNTIPEGEFQANIVVSVEFYAGKVGEQDGVKLEDEVWIAADGPVVFSLYPYDSKLLN